MVMQIDEGNAVAAPKLELSGANSGVRSQMEVKEVRADGEGDNQIKSIEVDIKPM